MDNRPVTVGQGRMREQGMGRQPVGLADLMRLETQALHEQAERTGFVGELLAGRATRYGYAVYLRNLLPAYQALERGLELHREVPGVGDLARPALYRAPALVSDLRTLHGPDWPESLPLLPVGERYGTRIEQAALRSPSALIAHAYVRYLGDLSGGRILYKLLARTMRLEASALAFYSFPQVDDPERAKRELRSTLDAAGRLVAEQAPVVHEAISAFRLNIAISEAVQDRLSHMFKAGGRR